jgi:Uma2 family endonuclease
VNDRQLHVFREPSETGYQTEIILRDEATISPLAFPNCLIIVREMLRPNNG